MIRISHESFVKILRVQLIVCSMNARDDLTIDLFIERKLNATFDYDDDLYSFENYDEYLSTLKQFIEYAQTRNDVNK
jgi:hypothetical protein